MHLHLLRGDYPSMKQDFLKWSLLLVECHIQGNPSVAIFGFLSATGQNVFSYLYAQKLIDVIFLLLWLLLVDAAGFFFSSIMLTL